MPSSHLILCRPLFFLPPIPPSIRVFSNESTLHMKWPKYWSFSFSIIPSKEHPGLISFRMDWLDLCVVHGTLKSLLQHHSSKASTRGFNKMSQIVLFLSMTCSLHLPMWDLSCSSYLFMVLLLQIVSFYVVSLLPNWSTYSPGSGRSPEEGNGYPLQYSYLENSMDRGAGWATVHGVGKESDVT